MKNLYIIGARGYGREIFSMFENCKIVNSELQDINCIGFLDDKSDALDNYPGYPPIISSVEDFIPSQNDVFLCALGDPKWVKFYTSIIENKGGNFISLISPLASIGSNTIIGKGVVISRWSTITSDTVIGDHTHIGVFSCIGHDIKIGECCHMGAYTFIGGRATIGKKVTIHPRVNILPDKKVGDDAIIGAGSIVLKNVKPGETVFGIPAKKIK